MTKRVEFKTTMPTYKILATHLPIYLHNALLPHQSALNLCISN